MVVTYLIMQMNAASLRTHCNLSYKAQMVDAVRALHAEGPVAHHDIKPQNVMIQVCRCGCASSAAFSRHAGHNQPNRFRVPHMQTRLPLPGAPPATTARAETEMVERKGEKATERQREPSEELGFESIALIAPAFREASDEGTRETCAGGVQDNGEPRDWAAFGESEGVGNGTFGEGGGGRGRREGAMWGVGRGDRGDKAGVEEGTGASAVCAWGPSELVGRYRAVLGDFGSCGAARVAVRSYRDVLEIKERAEALSTAPYRAPELFEPPGRGEIDERVDVWSLGCLLFYSMFGEGPFDFALTEGAGSIALAVLSGRPRWPRDWTPFPTDYKGPLARLVECCLQEAGSRCTAAELLVQAQEARREIMGDGAR